jgi:hypothetical protein
MYNHCNICNIHMKRLQHTYEISKILETYVCNLCFSSLLLDDAEQSGEQSVPASRRPRMVAW